MPRAGSRRPGSPLVRAAWLCWRRDAVAAAGERLDVGAAAEVGTARRRSPTRWQHDGRTLARRLHIRRPIRLLESALVDGADGDRLAAAGGAAAGERAGRAVAGAGRGDSRARARAHPPARLPGEPAADAGGDAALLSPGRLVAVAPDPRRARELLRRSRGQPVRRSRTPMRGRWPTSKGCASPRCISRSPRAAARCSERVRRLVERRRTPDARPGWAAGRRGGSSDQAALPPAPSATSCGSRIGASRRYGTAAARRRARRPVRGHICQGGRPRGRCARRATSAPTRRCHRLPADGAFNPPDGSPQATRLALRVAPRGRHRATVAGVDGDPAARPSAPSAVAPGSPTLDVPEPAGTPVRRLRPCRCGRPPGAVARARTYRDQPVSSTGGSRQHGTI